jgi:hypothetical protein
VLLPDSPPVRELRYTATMYQRLVYEPRAPHGPMPRRLVGIFYEIFMPPGHLFTTSLSLALYSICQTAPMTYTARSEALAMLDLFFLGLTTGFFIACLAYIVGCEQL